MQAEVVDGGEDRLAGARGEAHDAQARGVDLLRQLLQQGWGWGWLVGYLRGCLVICLIICCVF